MWIMTYQGVDGTLALMTDDISWNITAMGD